MVSKSQERWERLSALTQGWIDGNFFPGFVNTVSQNGELVYHDCQGWVDIDRRKAMRPDAIFRIYSMTKPITCTAMMMLFEEGKFFLDEPVTPYIPAFKDLKVYVGQDEKGIHLVDLERPITFRQLLTHTAGLGYGILNGPVEDMFRQSGIIMPDTLTMAMPLEQIIQRVAELPLSNQPGTTWRYSISHLVTGYLISVLSGMPFDQFLHTRVFEPLGMVDTGFWVPPEKLDRLATLYKRTEAGNLEMIDSAPDSPFARPPIAPAGGEGLVSTSADYLRFARMLLNGGELDGVRILSRNTMRLMTSNHLPQVMLPIALFPEFPMMGLGYGLGVSVMLDPAAAGSLNSPGTFGWNGAAGTMVFIDPKENLVGLMMTQTQLLASAPMPPHWDLFERLVFAAAT